MYEKVISLENLFTAWHEFQASKMKKADVSEFALNYEDRLFQLHEVLATETYVHSKYISFSIHDPKLRQIHKASVTDRVLHHALVRSIEPDFNKSFIFDSYSSRKTKGTHAANRRFKQFAWKLSRNNTKTVWMLKCDIRKFFNSVDHDTLLRLIRCKVDDTQVFKLLEQIIRSFETQSGKGIPLGNLTSQLFSNIYLNPFDHYVKRVLRVKHYIRYADDFVLMSHSKQELEQWIPMISQFLSSTLQLQLHENKVYIRKFHQGVDFLGYVHFPYHSVIRTKTKRRIFSKLHQARLKLNHEQIDDYQYSQTLQSYLGVLRHCCSKALQESLNNTYKPQ